MISIDHNVHLMNINEQLVVSQEYSSLNEFLSSFVRSVLIWLGIGLDVYTQQARWGRSLKNRFTSFMEAIERYWWIQAQ